MHGDPYGYLRNQLLNTANALSQNTLPLTLAQYGASFGGPIIHNRTFYFANFEQRQLNQNGIITITPSNARNHQCIAPGGELPRSAPCCKFNDAYNALPQSGPQQQLLH